MLPPLRRTIRWPRAAFEVLDKHCARCHQEGALSARERPAKNFGNVLKLDEIAANPHYVLPGNPFGSKLFKQIVDKEMPYDVEYEGETKYPSVTPDELEGAGDLDHATRHQVGGSVRRAQIRQQRRYAQCGGQRPFQAAECAQEGHART